MSNKDRLGFNFLKSYYEVLKRLPNNDSKIKFIEAICEMQFNGIEIQLEGIEEFAYASQKHSIEKSRKGWEDVQKRNGYTLPSVDPSEGGSVDPSEQEKEKEEEQVQVQEKVKDKEAGKFNFKKSLLELNADKQLVEDWLKVRKDKKASNTKTAFEAFKKELEKSKTGINEVLTICVENSWKGFKAQWLENLNKDGATKSTNGSVRATRTNGSYEFDY